MRSFSWLLVCMCAWLVPANAQSLEWELPPEVRGLEPMPMPEMGVHNHEVFNWYDDGPDDCCDNQHCRPFPVENFTENPDGSITFRHYDQMFGAWIVIEFAKEDVKKRPATAPPDPFFHPCYSAYINTEGGLSNDDGSPRIAVTKYCIFRPDSST